MHVDAATLNHKVSSVYETRAARPARTPLLGPRLWSRRHDQTARPRRFPVPVALACLPSPRRASVEEDHHTTQARDPWRCGAVQGGIMQHERIAIMMHTRPASAITFGASQGAVNVPGSAAQNRSRKRRSKRDKEGSCTRTALWYACWGRCRRGARWRGTYCYGVSTSCSVQIASSRPAAATRS